MSTTLTPAHGLPLLSGLPALPFARLPALPARVSGRGCVAPDAGDGRAARADAAGMEVRMQARIEMARLDAARRAADALPLQVLLRQHYRPGHDRRPAWLRQLWAWL